MFQEALFSFLSFLCSLGLSAAIFYPLYYNSAFTAPLTQYSFLFSSLKWSDYSNASQGSNTSSEGRGGLQEEGKS